MHRKTGRQLTCSPVLSLDAKVIEAKYPGRFAPGRGLKISYELPLFFSAFAAGIFGSGLAAGAAFGLQKSGSPSAHCLEG